MNTVKKSYVKPTLELVDFTLSSSIAGTCNATKTSEDVNSCAVMNNETEWLVYATFAICEDIQINSDSFCYHVPTEDAIIFAS